jgi:hypothetical protein
MVDTNEALRVARGDVGDFAHPKPKPVQSYEHLKQESGFTPLFRSSAGINYETAIDNATGDMIVRACQDVYKILELNQAMFTENKGYTPDKSMRRVASIPTLLRNKIMAEEGWDPWQPGKYPERYKRLMNDIDYRKLRTAEGRI